jgi:hypothetical protein
MFPKCFFAFMLTFVALSVSGCTNLLPTEKPDLLPAGDSGGGGLVNSEETILPGSAASSGPGSSSGYNPDTDMTPPPPGWLSYTDAAFGFSISYPDVYVNLPEAADQYAQIHPGLVHRVRFLDETLAKGETADLEPPKFSIEIYANSSQALLDQWLETNEIPAGAYEEVGIDGITCTRITMPILLAPNQFIYCAFGKNIYKFTPLGSHSQEMLNSFKFGQ